jgi:hypothetical protein
MWLARIQALKSFETMMAGDMLDVVLDERWAHLIANDYVRLVDRWDIPSASTDSKSESNPSKLDDA